MNIQITNFQAKIHQIYIFTDIIAKFLLNNFDEGAYVGSLPLLAPPRPLTCAWKWAASSLLSLSSSVP